MRLIFNKFMYRLDNFVSRGTFNIIVLIFGVIFLIAAFFATLVFILGVNENSPLFEIIRNLIFTSLKYKSSGKEFFTYEIIDLTMFILGLFLTATLIGAISAGINERLKLLKNSSSFIYEKGHIVILGFSTHVISLLKELLIANESEKKSCIVILGNQPRDKMKAIVNKNIKNFKNTKIIYREGDRSTKNSLYQLNLNQAKSIIINQYSEKNNEVHKTLLAIVNRNNRKKDPFHIVAVVGSKEEADLCKLIGKDEVEIIVSDEFLARLEAQTCRQSGLPIVYEELLNFDGDEIYFKKEKSLIGKRFSEALHLYNSSILIGISRKNKVLLNVQKDFLIGEDDQIIGISSDDSTFVMDNPNPKKIIKDNLVSKKKNRSRAEKFLFLGFNNHTKKVLKLLGKYTNKSSLCEIIIEDNKKNKTVEYNNLTVIYKYVSKINRTFLDKIKFKKYDFVIVQSTYNEEIGYDEDLVDNKTMSIIINLRDIKRLNKYSFKIISELFDTNNHDLIQNSQIDDFILSEKFISSAIAQISENKKLSLVFSEIFKPEGAEIYMKSVEDYVSINKNVDFHEVSFSACQKNEIAIGYRLEEFKTISSNIHNDKEMSYGIVINPYKSKYIQFQKKDLIIVFSEN